MVDESKYDEYMYQVDPIWTASTVIMLLNLGLCIYFAIATKLGDNYHKQRLKTRKSPSFTSTKTKQQFMAYWIYTFAALCAVQCFLCHYSMLWYQGNAYGYCRWGAPICVVLFFSAKCSLYGFFLERSKLAQGLLEIFPKWLFKYVLPSYIFVYWLVWTIMIMTLFEGTPNETVTSCIMEAYSVWILYIGGIVDVLNTALFLFLFLYPLLKAYKVNKTAFDSNIGKKRKFLRMMWFNVILSTICTFSSAMYLIILPSVAGYLWFMGQIDMMINGVCVFFMMASNRRYLTMQCNTYCQCCCYEWCWCYDRTAGKYQQVPSKTSKTKMTSSTDTDQITGTLTKSIGGIPETPDTITDNQEIISLNVESGN